MSQRGALYPWRTINGEEASAYYAAGTAQFHIDADVAFAFSKYRDLTGDVEFMYRDGAAAIFGPGTPIATAAIKILEILLAE